MPDSANIQGRLAQLDFQLRSETEMRPGIMFSYPMKIVSLSLPLFVIPEMAQIHMTSQKDFLSLVTKVEDLSNYDKSFYIDETNVTIDFSDDLLNETVMIELWVLPDYVVNPEFYSYLPALLNNASHQTEYWIMSGLNFSLDRSKWNLIISSGLVNVGGEIVSVACQYIDLTPISADMPSRYGKAYVYYLTKEYLNGRTPLDKVLTSLPYVETAPAPINDSVDLLLNGMTALSSQLNRPYTDREVIKICTIEIHDRLPHPPHVVIRYDFTSRGWDLRSVSL